jgi:hypothetical protein
MNSRVMVSLLVFLCLVVGAVNAADNVRTFSVRFSQQTIQKEEHRLIGDTYHLIKMEDLEITRQPGHPSLPVEILNIYVPRGKRLQNVRVGAVTSTDLPDRYLILPGQPEIPLSSGQMPEPVPPDQEIYSLSHPYPASPIEVATTGSMAGRKLMSLKIFPLQYVPSEQKVIVNEEIVFEVEFADTDQEPAIPEETRNARKLRRSCGILSKILVISIWTCRTRRQPSTYPWRLNT